MRGLKVFEDKGIRVWQLPDDEEAFWDAFCTRCIDESLTGVYFEGGSGLMSSLLKLQKLNYLFA